MTKRLIFLAFGAFALTCRGAEEKILINTLSPDKQSVIVERQNSDLSRDYYFARYAGHEKLGYVLPANQRQQISNIAIVASWNASSTHVALLVLYGTKLSELLLFSKGTAGRFQPVEWQQPDAEAIYRQHTGRTIPHPGDGHDEDAVGPWVDENTVCMVSGQDMQTEDPARYTHLLTTFKARIRGKRAIVSSLQLEGPLSDEADEKLVKHWGNRYFEATEQ